MSQNHYGLYDSPSAQQADSANRPQSLDMLSEQINHGAFLMPANEAREQGFLTELTTSSSELLYGSLLVTKDIAVELGIIGEEN